MVKTIVCWIGTIVTTTIVCAQKMCWEEEALYSSLSLSVCSHSPCSASLSAIQFVLLWWKRSSSHWQVGNFLKAGAVPRREGSSSNASTGLAAFTTSAELIALSSSVLDVDSLELNEACWNRNEEAALTVITAQTAQILCIKTTLIISDCKMASLKCKLHV